MKVALKNPEPTDETADTAKVRVARAFKGTFGHLPSQRSQSEEIFQGFTERQLAVAISKAPVDRKANLKRDSAVEAFEAGLDFCNRFDGFLPQRTEVRGREVENRLAQRISNYGQGKQLTPKAQALLAKLGDNGHVNGVQHNRKAWKEHFPLFRVASSCKFDHGRYMTLYDDDCSRDFAKMQVDTEEWSHGFCDRLSIDLGGD
jgi:hypothetical protein